MGGIAYYSLQGRGRWVVLDHPYVRKKRERLHDFGVPYNKCQVLKLHHSSATIHTQWFPKMEKRDAEIK